MRGYFISDNEILAYDNPKTEPSFHELYQIYKPNKQQTQKTLHTLRSRLAVLQEERKDVEDSLRLHVRNADLDFAVQLVGAARWHRELEQIESLIALNEFLLQRTNADAVKEIPITNFVQFNWQGFARCIFHDEKTASMKYYKRENRVHCFGGCGQKNVIQVYAQLNGISNRDAYFKLREMI